MSATLAAEVRELLVTLPDLLRRLADAVESADLDHVRDEGLATRARMLEAEVQQYQLGAPPPPTGHRQQWPCE